MDLILLVIIGQAVHIIRTPAPGTIKAGILRIIYIFSGPIATFSARICLSFVVGKAAIPLVLAAAPGMLYTALCAGMIATVLEKVMAAKKRFA